MSKDAKMAEGRMLKREISDSKKLGLLPSDRPRVVYFMMLPRLDVKGRLKADPEIIKGQICTMLHYSIKSIQFALEALHDVGLIILYQNNGTQFLEYTRFRDFQKLYPDKEAETKIPSPTPANSGELQRTPLKVKLSKVKESKEYMLIFDLARKDFYGTKRGAETEFDNFRKKHSDWKEVLPLLLPAIKNQIAFRARLKTRGEFVPPPKNFKTWLNNRCWEETFTEPLPPRQQTSQQIAASFKKRQREEWGEWIKKAPVEKLPTADKDPYRLFWLVRELRPELAAI